MQANFGWQRTGNGDTSVPWEYRSSALGAVDADASDGSLDGVRLTFWKAFRHLFPRNAEAVQVPGGGVVISWSVHGDPHARSAYATPLLLRFEDDLVELMEVSSPSQRAQLAAAAESQLREGLRGYDPYAGDARPRVITIG